MSNNKRTIMFLIFFTFFVLYNPCMGVDFTLPAIEGLNVTNVSELEKEGFLAIDNNDWKKLLSIAEKGLEQGLEDPVLYSMKGYALRKTGDSQNALIADSKAIEIQPNPVRYANRAMTYLSLRNYSAALSDAQNALILKPDYATAYAVEALAYSYLGNTSAAKENSDAALLLIPEDAANLHIAGIVAMNEGNCTTAIDYLERSITINPNYSLPWPSMPNATFYLEQTREECIKKP